MISKRLRRIAGKFQLEFYVITELHDQEANRVSDALMWMLGAGVQRQAEEGVELIQAKSLVEQITTLVQRQVEEEEAPQRSLNRTGPPLPPSAPRAAGPPASTMPSPNAPWCAVPPIR